ncbi:MULTISPECIES: hypothetical protein [Nonlabens]|uniref:Bestrophin RFP-TM (Chloride channel) n=1 Tax=Nonlabens xylanidelens TaxID=191564 RepID=A0A2S6IKY8_9FLAO|nr:hypothetical protein [Nonlabens xylanidelens]PPK94897.1 hypothetical protein LY01_01650 [Nonlabens xylanidelens]PQJ17446.1 hypothetical protein BST94_10325 [Nonlabens xylanidelens]
MKQFFNRFLLIVNLQTVIISLLAVISTAICIHYKYEAEFPLTLVATSIIFPIVFSIGGAYKRREAALKEYAAIKGYLRAIFFVSRDWLDHPKPENVTKMNTIIFDFFNNLRTMFTSPKEQLIENEKLVYDSFSDFSLYIKHELRGEGLSAGECSRTNQYLQKMMVSFESIKHIYQYRTPRTLRAFSSLFIKVLPILYGPYFAFKAEEMSWGLEFVIPILLTMILVSLENIQEHLENPFDQIGEDDIKFNVEKFVERLNHKSDD